MVQDSQIDGRFAVRYCLSTDNWARAHQIVHATVPGKLNFDDIYEKINQSYHLLNHDPRLLRITNPTRIMNMLFVRVRVTSICLVWGP